MNPSLKQQAHDLIERMPDSARWEDVAYEFIMRALIERGVADVDAGRVIEGREVLQWLESWGTDMELPPPRTGS